MASEAIRSSTSPGLAERVYAIASRWSVYAWMSIVTATAFIGVSFWWLTVNRAIPIWDAGLRLSQVIIVYEHLRAGQIGTALTAAAPYPPFGCRLCDWATLTPLAPSTTARSAIRRSIRQLRTAAA